MGEVVDPLCLSLHAFDGEAQALGNSTACHILARTVNLDSVQADIVKQVGGQGTDRTGHDPVTGTVGIQPVAERGHAAEVGLPILAQTPYQSATPVKASIEPLFLVELLPTSLNELVRFIDGLREGHPRHPAREMLPIGLDQCEELLRILGLVVP